MSTSNTKVIVKIGGSLQGSPSLSAEIAEDIQRLRDVKLAVVHGGGREIGRNLELHGIESEFVDGLRVTSREAMRIVEQVLSGGVNKEIVRAFALKGVPAVGISGSDGALLRAEKLTHPEVDLGYVGEVAHVNTDMVEMLWQNGYVPVVSPVAVGEDGQSYNVNADSAASKLARALQADLLVYLSDTSGVHIEGTAAARLNFREIENAIRDGIVEGGMIPKVRSAARAVAEGVKKVSIAGWEGAGTLPALISGESIIGTTICT